MTGKKCIGCKVTGALVIIGALNWGLVGIFQFNLVSTILGDMSMAARVVYGLVGLAGAMKLVCCFKDCPKCQK